VIWIVDPARIGTVICWSF